MQEDGWCRETADVECRRIPGDSQNCMAPRQARSRNIWNVQIFMVAKFMVAKFVVANFEVAKNESYYSRQF
jgi:hypothetical protein